MTDPNQPNRADILAAREIVKQGVPKSHWRDIDAGQWDAYSKVQGALAQLIRQREEEEVSE